MMKVSVVMPVYNGEKTVRAAVDSLLSQIYGDVEILVVNDGSNDATSEILESYGDRIRYICKPNGGVSSARNRGIEEATGEYLMFADADDVCHPDMVERAVECMEKERVDYVIAGFVKVSDDRRVDSAYGNSVFRGRQTIRDNLISILNNGLNAVYCKVYQTERIRENAIRFDETLPLGEDFNFNLEYLLSVDSVAYLDAALYDYMIFNSVATTAYREDLYQRRVGSIEKMNDTLTRNGLSNPLESMLWLKLLYAVVFNMQKKACPYTAGEKREKIHEAKTTYFSQKKAAVHGKYRLLELVARLCPPALFYAVCSLLRTLMRLLPEQARGLSV